MFEFKAKTALITAGIILGMLALAAGASWISGIAKNASENIKNSQMEENNQFGLPKTELKKDKERTNMLLLGIGGPDHTSGTLTDTLIFASVKTETKEANFISIPRDMWVFYESEDYPKEGVSRFTYQDGWQKINEIYHLSGGQEKPNIEAARHVAKKVSEVTGQPVHYAVIINLNGVEKIVDILGGIEVDGVHMTGNDAVKYIRDRSGPGSDFDRMKHQQAVLLAIQNKLTKQEELGLSKLLELYNAAQENIVTDAGSDEFLGFYELMGKIDPENTNMHTIAIAGNNLLSEEYIDLNGQNIYTLRPSAGKENYEEIQKFIGEILGM
ncbi:MAG: LCP family protein [Candidatus Spechtbacterales bacterium]